MKVKCRIQWCSWAFHIEMYSQIGRDKILKMKKRGGGILKKFISGRRLPGTLTLAHTLEFSLDAESETVLITPSITACLLSRSTTPITERAFRTPMTYQGR